MSKIGERVFHKTMMVPPYFGYSSEAKLMEVTIEIDVDKLMRELAPKARSNRSKRSKLAAGIVVMVKDVDLPKAGDPGPELLSDCFKSR